VKEDRKVLLFIFYLLFFLSGIAGLVYQTLWLRMFTLVLGNSLHSASIVFASFMCGLALGAWLLGKYIKGKKDVLAVYVILEFGIALTALSAGKAIPHLISLVPFFQRWLSSSPILVDFFRAAISFLVLLAPTALIGGTLPVLTHFLTRRLELAGKRIGSLYGWNTVGAVAGCVITSFWLLRLAGMTASLYVACSINLFVGVAALFLRHYLLNSPKPEFESPRQEQREKAGTPLAPALKRLLLAAAGITGAAALAYEVVWARFLSYILHNDIYAFYLMLSTILFGIGAGSLIYSRWLDRVKNRLRLLAWLEIALALAVGFCFLLCAFFYRWEGSTLLHIRVQNFLVPIFSNPFYPVVLIRLYYTLIAMLLPSLIMGAVFPLICRLYLTDEKSIGSQTGAIYAVNTTGAILGTLAAGFFLVPSFGVQSTLFGIAALNLGLGSAVFFYEIQRGGRKLGRELPVFIGTCLCYFLLVLLPGNQVRKFTMKDKKYTSLTFYREGLSGTVSVVRDKINGIKTLSINSIGEVHNSLTGMQTFKVLGHMPLLFHQGEPKNVLMVTFGAGIASGAVAVHPIENLDVVELEPSVVEASEEFRDENRGIVDDPRTRIHLDDGRYYLATTDKLFDVIISDATNPASSDSWLLYTLEFYRLCREKLAAGGVMAQWLPLHSGSPETYCTIVKTFQKVFPHTSIWYIKDYTMLIGLPQPLGISYPELVEKLSNESIRADLAPYCLDNSLELLDCFLMGERAARRMTEDARVSTDDLPLYQLESAELAQTGEIFQMLGKHRERLFPYLRGVDGPGAQALRDSLERYFHSQWYLLRRDFLSAARVNPASCKYRKYYQEYEEQVAYLEALAQIDPDNYRILTRVGMALVEHQELTKARKVFTRLDSLNPNDPAIYNTLGNINFTLGDYIRSARNYRKALELGRRDQNLLINLGLALFGTGRNEEGLKHLLEAVQLDSTSTDALYYLGVGYNRLRKTDKEAACYQKVLQLDPDYLEALINLGTLYIKQGKPGEAEQLFARALELDPARPLAWEGLGKILYARENYDQARKAFLNVLKLDPGNKIAGKYLERIKAALPAK